MSEADVLSMHEFTREEDPLRNLSVFEQVRGAIGMPMPNCLMDAFDLYAAMLDGIRSFLLVEDGNIFNCKSVC